MAKRELQVIVNRHDVPNPELDAYLLNMLEEAIAKTAERDREAA